MLSPLYLPFCTAMLRHHASYSTTTTGIQYAHKSGWTPRRIPLHYLFRLLDPSWMSRIIQQLADC
jgi:hypothetical protein